jgi:hypothetical protein
MRLKVNENIDHGLEAMSEALLCFKAYLGTRSESERATSWARVKIIMGDISLAGWVGLYIRVFYENIYTTEKIVSDNFLDLMENFNLRKLHNTVAVELRAVVALKGQKSGWLTRSYFDLTKLDEALVALDVKIMQLERQQQPMLSLYLMVQKIIGLLQEDTYEHLVDPLVLKPKLQIFQSLLMSRPLLGMKNLLLPMFKIFEMGLGAPIQESYLHLDEIIAATLNCLEIPKDNFGLIFLIRDALFENEVLAKEEVATPSTESRVSL